MLSWKLDVIDGLGMLSLSLIHREAQMLFRTIRIIWTDDSEKRVTELVMSLKITTMTTTTTTTARSE